jgi:hypothetical protein
MKQIIFSLLMVLTISSFTMPPVIPQDDKKNDWVYELTKDIKVIESESPLLLDWGTISLYSIGWNNGGGDPNEIRYAVNYSQRSYNRNFVIYVDMGYVLSHLVYDVATASSDGMTGYNLDFSDCSNCYYTVTINQSASTISWDY